MKIGFTSTTFRPIKDLKKIVDIAKNVGVDCIEWGGDIHVKNLEDAESARRLCEKAGIEISSYGSYYTVGSGDTDKWESICEIAAALGAKVIRAWLGEKGSKKTDDEYYSKIFADLVNICEIAEKYSIIVSPECHTNTYNDTTESFLKISNEFKEKSKSENFKTYFQSKYKNLKYDFDRIEKTVSEIEIVHISYSERMREQFFSRKNRNYVELLLQKLKSEGFDKLILLEYTYFSLPKYLIKDINRIKTEINK